MLKKTKKQKNVINEKGAEGKKLIIIYVNEILSSA